MSEYMSINLPSRCIPYPKVNPEDVVIRLYRIEDEKVLSQIDPVNLERKYLQVLKGIIKGIDPTDLTIGDRMYIVLWEYINSYSETMVRKTQCSYCMKVVKPIINLKELDIVQLPEDFKVPHSVKLSSVGEDGKPIHVDLRFLTVEDEIKTEKYADDHEDYLIYRYARSIVGPGEMSTLERIDWLSKLSHQTKDMARIRAFQNKFYHGPDFAATYKCPACGEEDVVNIPFRLDFFYPDGETLISDFGEAV